MFALKFVTSDKVLFNAEAASLIVPGGDGYLEILSHHAPIIITVVAGKVTITEGNKAKHVFAVSGGILDVVNNSVRLLCDAAEKASEIDPKRAEAAYERARKLLEKPPREIDLNRAKSSLQRAEMRLRIYKEQINK